MALSDFRLSADQSHNGHVTVLADDGKIRLIAHIAREAIDDRFRLTNAPQSQRVAIVERNLAAISRLIEARYAAGEVEPYVAMGNIEDPNNKLVVITEPDLVRVSLT